MRNTKLIVLFSCIAFIAVLIVLNSVVFAVRRVSVYCFNADDPAFAQEVMDAANIKKGQSILFMSESKPIKRITEKVINANVIDIERKFPNRVIISVAKLMPHGYIQHLDSYIILDNSGKILEVTDEDGFRGYTYGDKPLIELRLASEPIAPVAGAQIETDDSETEVYSRLLTALARVDYRDFDAVALLEYIDLTQYRYEQITMQTRGSDDRRGTIIKILGTSNLNDKIRLAVSEFIRNGDINRTEHIITVSNGANQPVLTIKKMP